MFVKKVLAKLRPDQCLGARVAPPEEVSFADGGALREKRWDQERRSWSLGGEATNSFTRSSTNVTFDGDSDRCHRTATIYEQRRVQLLVSVINVKPPPPTTCGQRGGGAGGCCDTQLLKSFVTCEGLERAEIA